MTRDDILARLRKVAALAAHGVGGEAANAAAMLDAIAAEHGIDLAECEAVFDHPIYSVEDTRGNYGEMRHQTLGVLHGQVVMLIWMERADGPRLISCRKATRHETRKYLKEILAF